jgi:hypothetical protein
MSSKDENPSRIVPVSNPKVMPMTGPDAYARQLKILVPRLKKEIILGVSRVFARTLPKGAKNASYLFL